MDNNKKKITYVGLVGRRQTAAISTITKTDLCYEKNKEIYKFDDARFYEHMYLLAAATIRKAVLQSKDIVLYTIDAIVNDARLFFKNYRRGQLFDFETFADKCLASRKRVNSVSDNYIKEKNAMILYFQTVASTFIVNNVSIKFEKAKEVDMLMLNVKAGTDVKPGDMLSFSDGKALGGNVSVFGWPNFTRYNALVKAKLETNADNTVKEVLYLSRNDRSPIGYAKSEMLRYLWSKCPNTALEHIDTWSRVS